MHRSRCSMTCSKFSEKNSVGHVKSVNDILNPKYSAFAYSIHEKASNEQQMDEGYIGIME